MHLTIALAQRNPTVGDIDGNLARIRRARDEAAAGGADLVVLPELALIATTPWREHGRVYNAAIVIDEGTTTRRFKCDLPNYGVFDEKRVFAPGPMPEPVNFRGITIGVPVCEDIWTPAVTTHLARAHAGDESCADVRQSNRRTGRAGVRRPIVRAQSLGRAGVLAGRLGGSDRADAMDARQ